MDLDGAVSDFAENRSIPIFGIANAHRFAGAEPGWHPLDLMPTCESVVVLGLPCVQHPLRMEERTYVANQSWWDAKTGVQQD